MKHRLDVLAVGLGILLAATPVAAQHSFSATYDSDRQVTLDGPVTRIDWVNPHAFFFINVRDAGGTITNWAVEFGNPFDLERDGWKRNTLHVGDLVAVEGIPARGAVRQAFAKSVVLKPGGKRLFAAPGRRASTSAAAPAPRWPNGHVRLGPPPGKKGYWGAASVKALVENRQSRAVQALGESRVRAAPAKPFERRSFCALPSAGRPAAVSHPLWFSIRRTARIGPHPGAVRGRGPQLASHLYGWSPRRSGG